MCACVCADTFFRQTENRMRVCMRERVRAFRIESCPSLHVSPALTEFTLCFRSNARYRLGRSKRGRARRREAGPFPPDNAIISAPLVRNAGFYRPLPSSRRQPKSLRTPLFPSFPQTIQHIYPSHQDWQVCQIGQFPVLSIFNHRAEKMALGW